MLVKLPGSTVSNVRVLVVFFFLITFLDHEKENHIHSSTHKLSSLAERAMAENRNGLSTEYPFLSVVIAMPTPSNTSFFLLLFRYCSSPVVRGYKHSIKHVGYILVHIFPADKVGIIEVSC